LALIPISATVYILWWVVRTTDALLGVTIPGLGLLVAIGLITLVGFLVSNVIGSKIYSLFDRLMKQLPVVTLLYTSIRDLLAAFVGEKKIGRPVAVRISAQSESRVLGLLTRTDLGKLGLPDHVAVYLPQAYNIGGQVLAVHRDHVEPIDIPSAEMLAFMMSGGASGLGDRG
jgi:uncharacterized membrane protein